MSAQLADVAMMEQARAARRPGGPRMARRSYAAEPGRGLARDRRQGGARAGALEDLGAPRPLRARGRPTSAAFVRAFPCPAGATGVAVGIGGKLVALELFDAASTLAEQWPRLVESAASAHADHRRAVAAGDRAGSPAIATPTTAPSGGMLGRAATRLRRRGRRGLGRRGARRAPARHAGPRRCPRRRRPPGPRRAVPGRGVGAAVHDEGGIVVERVSGGVGRHRPRRRWVGPEGGCQMADSTTFYRFRNSVARMVDREVSRSVAIYDRRTIGGSTSPASTGS